ncbi:MAG: siderophore-interacting protein [Aeromicrobium erythreum]
MARSSRLVKPDRTRLVKLQVRRRALVSPHLLRVTFGGGTIEHFVPRGYDQWFRLFIPREDDLALDRLPDKVDTLGYLRYLRIHADVRPELRNYSVRAYRADGSDGPEIDVDFVLHGSAVDGTAGPGAAFAETCEPGDWVGIVDEGLVFDPDLGTDELVLVTDETGVPGVCGILESLPEDATGVAILEVPSPEDVLSVTGPAGVEQHWVVRGRDEAPGTRALAELEQVPVGPTTHGYAVGETSLATGARRALVAAGVPKARISFCGYYRAGHA